MKTLFIITNLDQGGAEKQFIGLVNFLRGHKEIYVVTLFKTSTKSNLVIDLSLNMNRFLPSPIKIVKFFRFLWKLDPEVVVSFNYPALVFVKFSRIISRRFVHIISERNEYLGGYFKILIRKYMMTKNTFYNTNSISTLNTLIKFKVTTHDKISYIPNWVQIPDSNRKYKKNAQMKWLFIGRLIPQKNILFILRVFKEMVVQFPKIELWIVGSGYLEKKVLAYTLRNNLENNVFFLGSRENLEPIFNEFNYLILASQYEGSANVLLESISHGLIPISSKVGSYREIFLNQEFLVIDDFSIAKFSKTMSHLMTLSEEDFAILQAQLFENLNYTNHLHTVGNNWLELLKNENIKN
jgi:glycosyltransferase involved in cell wall biosynthesis